MCTGCGGETVSPASPCAFRIPAREARGHCPSAAIRFCSHRAISQVYVRAEASSRH